MRALGAAALFVSLFAGGCFADGEAPEIGYSIAPPASPLAASTGASWTAVHDAGLRAAREGRTEDELKYFLATWNLALTVDQQAISAEEIGYQLHRKGQNQEARQWMEKARALCLTVPGNPHLSSIDAILADIARDAADYAGAERLWRASMAEHPDDNIRLAAAQLGLADLLREQGRVGEAAGLFNSVLALDNIAPRQHVDALLGLADVDRGSGEWAASASEWNQAIEFAHAHEDPLSESVALRGLGETWLDAGLPARAEPLLRRALSLFESNPASPPEQTATVLRSLGSLYCAQNKLAMAEEMLTRALSLDRKVLGDNHPQVAQMMETLSWVYSERGELATAKDLSAQAWNVMSNTFGADSLPVAGALASRAFVEVRAKDLNAAALYYAEAVKIARHHPDYQRMQLSLIQRYQEVLKALHRNHEAGELNAEARVISNNLKVSPLR
jgi:tetratricopeptide (TPR) repeat protein